MKTLIAALVLIATPVAAQTASQPGQDREGAAAATLPNTFDRPGGAPALAAPLAPAAPAPDVARSEEALRAVIADLQSGEIDYAAFTDSVADAMRRQEAAVRPLIAGFGALQGVEFVGQENGADLFAVGFENAATQWIIGFDAGDRIAVLLFRPAPTE